MVLEKKIFGYQYKKVGGLGSASVPESYALLENY